MCSFSDCTAGTRADKRTAQIIAWLDSKGSKSNQPANWGRGRGGGIADGGAVGGGRVGGGGEIDLRSIEGMQSHTCSVTSLLACAVGLVVQESQSAS